MSFLSTYTPHVYVFLPGDNIKSACNQFLEFTVSEVTFYENAHAAVTLSFVVENSF